MPAATPTISKKKPALLAVLLAALPMSAFAHPGHSLNTDFATGFAHPFSGFDHLLAMIAVGLWAAQLGGRAVFLVPLSFVSLMLMGAALGAAHIVVPASEPGIATSVLVLGVMVAASVRLPLTLSTAVVGAFALFHGYAHSVEMPYNAAGVRYALGFAVATATLHAIGFAAAVTLGRLRGATIRWAGAAVAIGGAALLLS